MVILPCFFMPSDPQGDQAPPVEPSVHLHHPGGLYGDRCCGWLCSLPGEVSRAAVQPHHHLSEPAVRSVFRENAHKHTRSRPCTLTCQCNKPVLGHFLFKVWQLFHVRVWESSWVVCWWRSWICQRWEPSAWPCWSTWYPPPATSPSSSWAVTRVLLQEWRSHTATSKKVPE